MSDTRRERLGQIMQQALALPAGAERDQFVRAQAGSDAELESEARSLLIAMDQAGGFLRDPTVRTGVPTGSAAIREGPGAQIGRYKILQQIGEGGFGAVFMAEQREPVHRRVALKIIKLGMDTRQVVARFEAERQALAIMDHPNIARVLDAGATEAGPWGGGRPYFVMELVKGDPITAYCDAANLPIPERLDLFMQVCQAVQHAHQKGVIHRDLKPSNVLVSIQDGRPLAKVIDFGIAKATHSRLTEKTLFTEHRQLIGTPAYMSPEQADGSLDVDTRTDIYSLGVLLYELLTGSTPFDERALRSAAFGEIQRIIREEEPPKPSTRLSQSTQTLPSIAARRHVEPRRLGTLVRGDLDWIVMRCLEKDRGRRYDTAASLESDLRRHLAGEPVVAAPPGAAYRARKFVRRHRVGVAAGLVVAGALLAGLAATSYGLFRAIRAERLAVDRLGQVQAAEKVAVERFEQAEKSRAEAVEAKDKAEQANRVASAVTEFFTKDLLDLHAVPEGGKQITVRELLDAVPTKIDKYFKSDPAVEGIIRERVGQLYRRIGEIERSKGYLQDAVPLLEKGLGPSHKQTLSAIHRLGELHMDLRQHDRAAELFDKAYNARLAAYGMDYVMTGSSLTRRGAARVAAGRTDEGLADLREILKYTQTKEGRDGRNAVLAAMDLCAALNQVRQYEESAALSRESLEAVLRQGGNMAHFEWAIRFNLAGALGGLQKHAEALDEADKALAMLAKIYPSDHQTFVEVRQARGDALAGLRRFPDAAAELETAYSIAAKTYGSASTAAREVAQARAGIADLAGDPEGAATWRERSK